MPWGKIPAKILKKVSCVRVNEKKCVSLHPFLSVGKAVFLHRALKDRGEHERKHCGYGVIGSRVRLRIWFREEWGFESPYPHRKVKIES